MYVLYVKYTCIHRNVENSHSLGSLIRQLTETMSNEEYILQVIKLIGDYEVEKCCPTDSKLKYNYIKVLKSSGLPFPAVLTTYIHGNNLGNLNFVWKVSSNSETAFSDSRSVIESVKKHISIFHTREMNNQMFQKFGHLMSNMQPGIMRHIYRSFTGTVMYNSL